MNDKPDQPALADVWAGPWPGSRAEFAALVEMYVDRLVRYAFRQLGRIEDAEDVVQDVFARTLADSTLRKRIRAVGPYLYRSVANACTDHVRKRSRAAVFREEVGIDEVLSGRDDPHAQAQAADELRRAAQLLRRVPEEQAEAIRLRVFDGLRLNEIADVVGCSVNTVCSRLRYGFQKLRDIVAEKGESGR